MNEPIKFVESGSIGVNEKGTTLPDREARFVMLSNWNVENNFETLDYVADGNNGLEVMWGFHGAYAHQLFSGQSTPLIPVANLSNISLRSRPGAEITIWFSFFK